MTPPTQFKLAMLFAAVAALGACGGGSSTDPATAAATDVSARSERLTPQAIFTPTSGIWWNPQESGRGFTFELQGTQIFMAMYTYETTGAATWYAATLTQQANGSFTGTLDRYSGGQSLTGSYRAPTLGGKVADITLTFSSATAASLLIQPSDGSAAKTVPLERFVFSAAASTGTFQSGYWWNEAQSGRGFLIDAQGTVVYTVFKETDFASRLDSPALAGSGLAPPVSRLAGRTERMLDRAQRAPWPAQAARGPGAGRAQDAGNPAPAA